MNRNRRKPTYVLQRLTTDLASTALVIALLTERLVDHWITALASTGLMVWWLACMARDTFFDDNAGSVMAPVPPPARLSADVQRGTQPPMEDQP